MGVPVQITVAALGLLFLAAVLVASRRSRIRARRDLAAAQAETAQLRDRLDELSDELRALRDGPLGGPPQGPGNGLAHGPESYLITDAGLERPEPNVPDRVVLTATFGEPLVKAVALGHGLARALSPASRNRIWFEMKREVRRARKQRRREMKEAWRQRRDEERAEAA